MSAGRLPKGRGQVELGESRTYFTRERNVVQLLRAARYANEEIQVLVDAGRPRLGEVRGLRSGGRLSVSRP